MHCVRSIPTTQYCLQSIRKVQFCATVPDQFEKFNFVLLSPMNSKNAILCCCLRSIRKMHFVKINVRERISFVTVSGGVVSVIVNDALCAFNSNDALLSPINSKSEMLCHCLRPIRKVQFCATVSDQFEKYFLWRSA